MSAGGHGVQEKADSVFAATLLQFLSKRDQVIVVHPYDVILPEDLFQLICEHFIDAVVCGLSRLGIFSEVGTVVEDGPKNLIGEAVVIIFQILLRKIGKGVSDAADFLFRQR